MKKYAVHQVDRNGAPLKTSESDSKQAATELYRYWARSLPEGLITEPGAVEVCLYDERIGEMLLSTARPGDLR